MGKSTHILSAVFFLAACAPDLGNAPFYCNAGGKPECPTGYACNPVNICVPEGTCPAGIRGCPDHECGDGSCDPDETCGTCEQDCGQCTSCGNGVCDLNESCGICEQDCGQCTNTCGNGVCDGDENALTCPTDCQSGTCEGEQTECVGAQSLGHCENGTWKTSDCTIDCVNLGYDYTSGCKFAPDKNKDSCFCGYYSQFGELCTDDKLCAEGLVCAAFEETAPGFCTKFCSTYGTCSGGPPGTQSDCNLNIEGQSACGFLCGDLFSVCPNAMHCDPFSEICKP